MTGRFEVGLRRDPDLDPDAPLPDGDPWLLGRIRAEIRAAGPMTFARFMELALYDPESGYYSGTDASRGPRGPGRRGDFLTAPESHPIFGWTVARRLEQLWLALDRPSAFVVREHGAGSGALAIGILAGLRRSASPLREAIHYQPIEMSATARGALAEAADAAGVGDAIEEPDARSGPGAVLANELLDALPVHRLEGVAGGALLERYVTVKPDDRLATELGPPSTPALAARLQGEGIRLEPGQPAEVCLAIDGWVCDAVRPLERGLLVVIDYGWPAPELYAPERGSTLRAYHRHRVHADPLVAVGRQDLTAHVDLTAVERAAATAGLAMVRRTNQAAYLAELGLGELLVELQTGPDASLESYLAARSAVVRLLDRRATGGFAVLELGRGLAA